MTTFAFSSEFQIRTPWFISTHKILQRQWHSWNIMISNTNWMELQQSKESYYFLLSRVCCMLSRFSHARLFATPWTIACQAPLSMGFSRQEYWSGLPCPPPGDLPDPGTEPTSLMPSALAGKFFTTITIWEFLPGALLQIYLGLRC